MRDAIITCEPRRTFKQELVAFIVFARRPPRDLLAILRRCGSYRRGAGGGVPGWYIPYQNIPVMHAMCLQRYPTLASFVFETVKELAHRPADTIPCPSKEGGIFRRRIINVVKMGTH